MKGRIKRPENKTSFKIPIVGKIKVGEKTEKGYPKSLDYFKCISKYSNYFTDAYGEKPKKIQICFISDNFEDSCNERYECRDKEGRLSGKSDGKTWLVWNNKKRDYFPESDKSKIRSSGKWEIILTINFIVLGVPGVMGLFSFSTKGKESSINSIRDTFDMVLEQVGTVINIPFDLTVEKVKSQKPGSKYAYPVVNLVPNISRENMERLSNYLNQGNDIKKIAPSKIEAFLLEKQ